MKNRKGGQVLLITVMLVATVITVVMTLVFKTNIDTQTTKLQEESQKALAAAEAGIERGLTGAQGTFNAVSIGLSFSGIDAINSNVTIDSNPATEFVSPLIAKDEQYTFYLTGYDMETKLFSGLSPTSVVVYYGSNNNCTNISLELTLISGVSPGPYTLTRKVADTGGIFYESIPGSQIGTSPGGNLITTSFNCKTSAISIPADPRLLIVRVFNSSTKIGISFNGQAVKQGNLITSSAKTTTGVVKKIQLFQSYPQIPADFFVTSF
jgi:hypothetical protein